jgi:hypothetical protein
MAEVLASHVSANARASSKLDVSIADQKQHSSMEIAATVHYFCFYCCFTCTMHFQGGVVAFVNDLTQWEQMLVVNAAH